MSIYLDHNATTPLDERVVDIMRPYWRERYGNPSSLHRPGRLARAALDRARGQVAARVNAQPTQEVFTRGGTAESLAAALKPETRLVAVMWANNETGVIQDVAAISAAARAAGAVMHCDAVQAFGKVPVDFVASGVQLMSLSAHKIYGPKGGGALIIDKTLDLHSLLHGGGHERGLRAGTENLAGIVGFGAAAELAQREGPQRCAHLLSLREQCELRLRQGLPAQVVASAAAERLPNTVMVAVPGIDGPALLMNLDEAGIAVSSGSACAAGSTEPSHVLLAMGFSPELARSVIRVSFGVGNSGTDVEALVTALSNQCERMRSSALTAW